MRSDPPRGHGNSFEKYEGNLICGGCGIFSSSSSFSVFFTAICKVSIFLSAGHSAEQTNSIQPHLGELKQTHIVHDFEELEKTNFVSDGEEEEHFGEQWTIMDYPKVVQQMRDDPLRGPVWDPFGVVSTRSDESTTVQEGKEVFSTILYDGVTAGAEDVWGDFSQPEIITALPDWRENEVEEEVEDNSSGLRYEDKSSIGLQIEDDAESSLRKEDKVKNDLRQVGKVTEDLHHEEKMPEGLHEVDETPTTPTIHQENTKTNRLRQEADGRHPRQRNNQELVVTTMLTVTEDEEMTTSKYKDDEEREKAGKEEAGDYEASDEITLEPEYFVESLRVPDSNLGRRIHLELEERAVRGPKYIRQELSQPDMESRTAGGQWEAKRRQEPGADLVGQRKVDWRQQQVTAAAVQLQADKRQKQVTAAAGQLEADWRQQQGAAAAGQLEADRQERLTDDYLLQYTTTGGNQEDVKIHEGQNSRLAAGLQDGEIEPNSVEGASTILRPRVISAEELSAEDIPSRGQEDVEAGQMTQKPLQEAFPASGIEDKGEDSFLLEQPQEDNDLVSPLGLGHLIFQDEQKHVKEKTAPNPAVSKEEDEIVPGESAEARQLQQQNLIDAVDSGLGQRMPTVDNELITWDQQGTYDPLENNPSEAIYMIETELSPEVPKELVPEQPKEQVSEQPKVPDPEQPKKPVLELINEPVPEQPKKQALLELIKEPVPQLIKEPVLEPTRHERVFLPAGHGLQFGFSLGQLDKAEKMKLEIFSNSSPLGSGDY